MKFGDLSSVCIILVTCLLMFGRCEKSAAENVLPDSGLVVASITATMNSSGVEDNVSSSSDETARFGFSPPQIPMDAFFPQFSAMDGNNGTANPNPLAPIAASLAIAKGGLLAVLSLVKAALPQALLVGVILALLVTGVALIACTVTDCGPSWFSTRGSNPFDPDFHNRNSYDSYDYDKMRHVYQGIDEHKYKYNHINHEKEYPTGI